LIVFGIFTIIAINVPAVLTVIFSNFAKNKAKEMVD